MVQDFITWGALITALGSVGGLVTFWVNRGRAEGAAEARLVAGEAATADSKRIALEAHAKVALLESAFGIYRERIAAEYVSRLTLREVEDRISGAIEKLGDRLDRSFEDRELRRQK